MRIENCVDENNDPVQSCSGMIQATADALYVIGGKWKLPIIIALHAKPRRFNELQRTLVSISPRILSNELKEMELNGFLKRNVNATATAVIVEYELAEYSRSLGGIVRELVSWGTSHRNKLISDERSRVIQ
jgi:DNA-binding HxlR family transcriptional regulator